VQEPHEGRHALALSIGAVPAEAATADADHVFETSGAPEALESALRHVAPGGKVTVIGMNDAPLTLTSRELTARQLSLTGSLIYDHPHDFADTVAALEDGSLAPGRVLQAEFSLSEAAAAFDAVASTPGKCWINLGGSAG